jgi:hypothetical protein
VITAHQDLIYLQSKWPFYSVYWEILPGLLKVCWMMIVFALDLNLLHLSGLM